MPHGHATSRKHCHARTNSTHRANVGIERGRGSHARTAGYASEESPGATASVEASTGTDREAKTRA